MSWTHPRYDQAFVFSIGERLGEMPGTEGIREPELKVTGDDGGQGDKQSSDLPSAATCRAAELKSSTNGESTATVGKPFVLSEGLPPNPHKLAAKILQGNLWIWQSY